MAQYQNYELAGNYFTAGENTPMYSGYQTPTGWLKYETKPYDTLLSGKTYPMKIAGVLPFGGKTFFYCVDGFSSKLNANVATFFEKKDNTIAALFPDITHADKSSYYAKPEESGISSALGSLKTLVYVGLGAWVLSSFFKGSK